MLKKFSKKIALAVNVLMFLQMAFLGLGANAGIANAEEVTTNNDKVVSLTLVEAGVDYASDDVNIKELKDGDVLNLSELPKELSVVATTDPEEVEGSVRFDAASWQKEDKSDLEIYSNYENYAPYALAGDGAGKYLPTDLLSKGSHTLTVTPFDLQNGKGNAGITLTVNFSVIDAPVVTNIYDDSYLVNEKAVVDNPEITIPVVYNEAMNQEVAPAVTVTPDVSTTVVPVPEKSKWVSDEEYDFVYELKDVDVEFPTVDVTVSGAKDLDGNVQIPFTYLGKISIDTKAPTVAVSAIPTGVNDAGKFKTAVFTGSENMELVGLGATISQGPHIEALVPAELSIKENVVSFNLSELKFTGKEKIIVTANFKDEAGNETGEKNYEIVPDTTAPVAVTGLTVTLDEGSAVLTWTNPIDNTDVDHIEIRRDGVFVTTLPAEANTFTDESVEKGSTYYYEVFLVDDAGNSSTVARVDLTVPSAKVAAVASDTAIVAPKTKTEDKPEVKSETSENKEIKKDAFPLWGILLLLCLAAVGVYLYVANEKGKNTGKPIAQVAPAKSKVKSQTKKTKK